MARHRRTERNPVQGRISSTIDTGRGSRVGKLSQDEVDALDAPTERQGRFKPAAKLLDESRGTDPLHKKFER
jgi:hypothetical protein